jgi:hypothetical protein
LKRRMRCGIGMRNYRNPLPSLRCCFSLK